jgi:hypothetical protein
MVRVAVRRAGDGAEMVIIELMPDGIAAVEASPVVGRLTVDSEADESRDGRHRPGFSRFGSRK